MNSIHDYKEILAYWRIVPESVQDFGKVKKVTVGRNVFALKEANIKYLNKFNEILNFSVSSGLKNILYPFIHTKGTFYVIAASKLTFYYLLPWIEEKVEAKVNKEIFVINELANLHQKTLNSSEYKDSDIEDTYNQTSKLCEERLKFYKEYIEECEKHEFMSPFQLLFCLSFAKIRKNEQRALSALSEWNEFVKEKKKYRYSLCHGKPYASHLIMDHLGNNYFLNLENAQFHIVVKDLFHYFYRLVYGNYEITKESLEKLLGSYEEKIPLNRDEKLWLLYSFCQTNSLHRLINRYKQGKLSEIAAVQKLFKIIHYTELISGLYDYLQQARPIELKDDDNTLIEENIEKNSVN